jgi:cytochrome b-561
MAPLGAGALRAPLNAAAIAARALALLILALVCWWVGELGGVSASPDRGPDGVSVKTSRLFNWHPVLMTLAFPVLMSEALLAYRAPWRAGASR